MRQYDDPVEVRRGVLTRARSGAADDGEGAVEGPEQFLWRGRLWKVHDVVAHWVETGAWWQSRALAPVLGTDVAGPTEGTGPAAAAAAAATASAASAASADGAGSVHDLLGEREVWRVEADRGLAGGRGVFDLVFDWSRGSWVLARCWD